MTSLRISLWTSISRGNFSPMFNLGKVYLYLQEDRALNKPMEVVPNSNRLLGGNYHQCIETDKLSDSSARAPLLNSCRCRTWLLLLKDLNTLFNFYNCVNIQNWSNR